ncbi:(Fe-S)-binding protein [Bacteroidota bacterium]|nr:(Fe-S)-binding protein [Bacteroidota bacterium]
MNYLDNVLFAAALILSISLFIYNFKKILSNIRLGRDENRSDNPRLRLNNMLRVAFGQSKMIRRPIAGILHLIVYVGFIIINIELLEIIIDGIFGSHRIFSSFFPKFYNFIIGSFEVLALLVLISVIIFWIRRNILKIKRFFKEEIKGWPKLDADLILYFEIILMTLFLTMNGADYTIQLNYPENDIYVRAGSYPISQFLVPILQELSLAKLILLERFSWWFHILGIFIFLNYLYYSKHLHILLAFPNTYFANLESKGKFKNIDSVTSEIKLMLDDNNNIEGTDISEVETFGASDVTELTWIQLLNAYSCTECGRCTSNCPANISGKKLSPRKIMMDTRDRLTELSNKIRSNSENFKGDGKKLLGDYISTEEVWACTSCNACVESCPIDIDPLSIIMSMRQYLVLENSAAPSDLNNMMNNIENNGAPWPFNQQDRTNWIN